MPDRIDHTYMFKAGLWRVAGVYYDDSGRTYPVEGESRITHRNALWYNESEMKILGSESIVFSNYYEIEPFRQDQDATSWTSTNEALGRMSGRFVLADDGILAVFHSENMSYTGTEFFLRVSATKYRNWGTLVSRGEKLSSWVLQLERV